MNKAEEEKGMTEKVLIDAERLKALELVIQKAKIVVEGQYCGWGFEIKGKNIQELSEALYALRKAEKLSVYCDCGHTWWEHNIYGCTACRCGNPDGN